MSDKNTARAFWVRQPGVGELRDGTVTEPGAGELRVRTLYSAISRGTETLVFRGRVPESQHKTMRCPFQEGHFPAPVKYGYMSVGVVEAAGPAPATWKRGRDAGDPGTLVGRTVFCLHPHQERYVVPADWVTPLPDGVPPGRAVLAANLETAVNGVWDGAPSVGDRIAVVGGGVVGLLVAYLAQRIPGTEVVVVDPEPARDDVVGSLGARWFPTPETAMARAAASVGGAISRAPARHDDGNAFDVVFHASGNPAGAAAALGMLGDEGLLVELSWYGERVVSLPLGEDFHARRLTIRSSQVGRIPPGRVPRWSHARRMATVMELLHDPALEVLITGESPFEALPQVMTRLAADEAVVRDRRDHEGGAASRGPAASTGMVDAGLGLPDPRRTLCHRIRYTAPE